MNCNWNNKDFDEIFPYNNQMKFTCSYSLLGYDTQTGKKKKR
jgi:hypothetical protein